MKYILFVILLPCICACNRSESTVNAIDQVANTTGQNPYIVVLGTIQDGGSPHIGCKKECCRELFVNPDPERMVVSLGIIDPVNQKTYLIEATPDMPRQMKHLKEKAAFSDKETPDGIFMTHAHIGHYAGLMYLGREALGGNNVPVYVMPRMREFLESNGPWSQLVDLNNISLKNLKDGMTVELTPLIRITPLQVPHRDEYSETVGYRIKGPSASLLFIPDIDKWGKWEKDIRTEISKVDFALLDGSFYNGEELNHRDMSEIPHPFLVESINYFNEMSETERQKVHFIHFNHTNPVLENDKTVIDHLEKGGYSISRIFEQYPL